MVLHILTIPKSKLAKGFQNTQLAVFKILVKICYALFDLVIIMLIIKTNLQKRISVEHNAVKAIILYVVRSSRFVPLQHLDAIAYLAIL